LNQVLDRVPELKLVAVCNLTELNLTKQKKRMKMPRVFVVRNDVIDRPRGEDGNASGMLGRERAFNVLKGRMPQKTCNCEQCQREGIPLDLVPGDHQEGQGSGQLLDYPFAWERPSERERGPGCVLAFGITGNELTWHSGCCSDKTFIMDVGTGDKTKSWIYKKYSAAEIEENWRKTRDIVVRTQEVFDIVWEGSEVLVRGLDGHMAKWLLWVDTVTGM
jgi:hypothetical protein